MRDGRDRVSSDAGVPIPNFAHFAKFRVGVAAASLPISVRWPTQARFWLEWGCSLGMFGGSAQLSPTLSSRPEQIIAKAMICGAEGPAVVTSTGTGSYSKFRALRGNLGWGFRRTDLVFSWGEGRVEIESAWTARKPEQRREDFFQSGRGFAVRRQFQRKCSGIIGRRLFR
jgi:hypothetical protein